MGELLQHSCLGAHTSIDSGEVALSGVFLAIRFPAATGQCPPSTLHPCELPASTRGHNLDWVMAMPSAHSIGLEILPIDGEDLARPERFGGHDE
jgi:hypothetical protein